MLIYLPHRMLPYSLGSDPFLDLLVSLHLGSALEIRRLEQPVVAVWHSTIALTTSETETLNLQYGTVNICVLGYV